VANRPFENWTLRPQINEGTSSPFMGRMFLGMFRIRDGAIGQSVKTFNDSYRSVFDHLKGARTTIRRFLSSLQDHCSKVERGEVFTRYDNHFRQSEAIDDDLQRLFVSAGACQ
jgi:hypothetical protein